MVTDSTDAKSDYQPFLLLGKLQGGSRSCAMQLVDNSLAIDCVVSGELASIAPGSFVRVLKFSVVVENCSTPSNSASSQRFSQLVLPVPNSQASNHSGMHAHSPD